MQGDYSYLFKIKEDRIEAEKHESHCSSEPTPSFVVECVCIEPGANPDPALWLVELVGWVRCSKDEGVDACERSESGNIAHCIVKAHCLDKVAQHSRVNHTRNTGAACNVAYSEASALGEPSGSDYGLISN